VKAPQRTPRSTEVAQRKAEVDVEMSRDRRIFVLDLLLLCLSL
jgi:hypothetical protein